MMVPAIETNSTKQINTIKTYLKRPLLGWLFMWLFLVISCLWLTQWLQQIQRQNQHIQSALQQISFNVEQRIRPLQQQLQQQQQQLDSLQQALQQSYQSPKLLRQKQQLLATQYLIEQAQLNLNFGRDVPSAIVILQTADSQIRQLNDLHYLNLRQRIAQALVSLQTVPVVDEAGILAKLQALIQQTESLSLLTANPLPDAKAAAADKLLKPTHWHHIGRAIWQQLQQIIIIRHHNNPIEPLLEPQQEAYLRHNLQLLLQQAQWAVLHVNVNLYQASLDSLQNIITEHFSNNTDEAKGIIAVITELQQVQLKPNLPDLMPIVKTINELLLELNNSVLEHNTNKLKSDLNLSTKSSLLNSVHSATLEAVTL